MSKSIMRQARETWLKEECVSISRPLFKLSYFFDKLVDNLAHKDYVEAIRTVDEIKYLHMVPENLIPEIQAIINDIKTFPPGTPERISAGIASIVLKHGVEDYIMEKVVECQCGKPMNKKLLSYTPASLFPKEAT